MKRKKKKDYKNLIILTWTSTHVKIISIHVTSLRSIISNCSVFTISYGLMVQYKIICTG